MPNVVNVLDHWIDLYSNDRDEPATADYLFWFGYDAPPNILVTTCLSALTLGVDLDNRQVGTVGVRVHRYVWLGKDDQIRYREIPPAPEWNSERISRCVSVEVRQTVFYANAVSLSTVYVFDTPSASAKWARMAVAKARRLVAFEGDTGDVRHSVDVVGAPGDLRDQWSQIEEHALARTAELTGRPVGGLDLIEVKPTGRAGMARVDPVRRRLVRPRTIELKRD